MRAIRGEHWIRFTVGFLALFFLSISVAGCGGQTANAPSAPTDSSSGSGKPLIVATIYPLYDLARQIGGEYVEVYELVPPGQVPHGFEPTPKDLQKIADANLFFYNGAGMEAAWIQRALESVDTTKTKVIEAAQGLDLIRRTTGAQGEGTAQGNGVQEQVDPHFWTPRNMTEVAKRFTEALVEINPVHKAEYEKNRDSYINSLESLDKEFQNLVNDAKYKEFYVSRPPFSYLAKQYGLKQISIAGLLGTEGAPTAQQIKKVVDQVKESGVPAIGSIYGTKDDIAETVSREAGVEAIPLYSFGTVTREQFDKGVTYQDLFRGNIDAFSKLLGRKGN